MEYERKVSYYYDPEIGDFYYGQGHPMKPHRVRLTHTLIHRYGLHKHLEVYKPVMATPEMLSAFHSPEYVEFLGRVNPRNAHLYPDEIKRHNVAADCPVFDGMLEYCQRYTGGSLGGAVRLNHGLSDVVINWAGGLHHAHKDSASGFCYINDIVLAILELLKYHHRVLYVDIDVHHGDGVEQAFLTTDRVMTLSLHKHGDNFFPGTGGLHDVGVGAGRHYAVNVPLNNGMDDDSYQFLFKPIIHKIMTCYQPGAIVLQSGADSLAHDKLGVFNLSIKGHAACHRLLASYGVPLLVLGGGGYKIKNVARCWTYETGVLLGKEQSMADPIPPNEYYEYFGPDYNLHIHSDKLLENCNKREMLEELRNTVLESLSYVHPVGAPFAERLADGVSCDVVRGQRGGSAFGLGRRSSSSGGEGRRSRSPTGPAAAVAAAAAAMRHSPTRVLDRGVEQLEEEGEEAGEEGAGARTPEDEMEAVGGSGRERVPLPPDGPASLPSATTHPVPHPVSLGLSTGPVSLPPAQVPPPPPSVSAQVPLPHSVTTTRPPTFTATAGAAVSLPPMSAQPAPPSPTPPSLAQPPQLPQPPQPPATALQGQGGEVDGVWGQEQGTGTGMEGVITCADVEPDAAGMAPVVAGVPAGPPEVLIEDAGNSQEGLPGMGEGA